MSIHQTKLEKFKIDLLNEHNKARLVYGNVPPLMLDNSLNEIAQRYADLLASKQSNLVHSNHSSIGENLFQYFDSELKLCPAELVSDSFLSESSYYNFNNPKLSDFYTVGHFTQMVWKNSSMLGVGVSQSKNGLWYVVCNYFPQGNIRGMYQSNVLKPIGF